MLRFAPNHDRKLVTPWPGPGSHAENLLRESRNEGVLAVRLASVGLPCHCGWGQLRGQSKKTVEDRRTDSPLLRGQDHTALGVQQTLSEPQPPVVPRPNGAAGVGGAGFH